HCSHVQIISLRSTAVEEKLFATGGCRPRSRCRLLYVCGSVKIGRTENVIMLVRTRLIALLLFGSGFCALIYQTTWLREFRLIFGASTAASAAVLGVFMAGLGFGGIILGRRSETKARPLAFYARLEAFITISSALSPLLISA